MLNISKVLSFRARHRLPLQSTAIANNFPRVLVRTLINSSNNSKRHRITFPKPFKENSKTKNESTSSKSSSSSSSSSESKKTYTGLFLENLPSILKAVLTPSSLFTVLFIAWYMSSRRKQKNDTDETDSENWLNQIFGSQKHKHISPVKVVSLDSKYRDYENQMMISTKLGGSHVVEMNRKLDKLVRL